MKKIHALKIIDIIVLVFAYLSAILVSVGFNAKVDENAAANAGETAIYLGIGLIIFVLVLLIPSYIISIINSASSDESVAKHNMKMKLVYIPFFVLNFFSGLNAILTQSTLGFLMVLLLVVFSYLIMFKSSLSNIVYFYKKYITKKLFPSFWSIISIIASFIFCLDVVAAIVLFRHEKNQQNVIGESIENKKYNAAINENQKWNSKKHMSLSLYKILSILGSVVLYIATTIFIYSLVKLIIDNGNTLSGDLDGGIFVLIIVAIIFKNIIGIIYGKLGEDSPSKFICVMKLVDMLPTIVLFAASVFYFVASTLLGAMAFFLTAFIVVIVIFFVIFAFLLVAMFGYLFSAGLFLTSIGSIYGNTMCLFTYYMNQRKVKNRKFSSARVVVCLVLLWFPITNIFSVFALRKIEKKQGIFSATPVFDKPL